MNKVTFGSLGLTPRRFPRWPSKKVIAEKIQAASQRSKIRDLYDLAEISRRPLDQDLIRSLAVLKLWQVKEEGLDFARFRQRIEQGDEYDVGDLQNLLHRD